MGYETRLYVVEKTRNINSDSGKRWAQVVAMFELSKAYRISDRTRYYPETDCFFYADDGNTDVLKDDVGDPLKELPVEDAIEIIEDAMKEDDIGWYRDRFMPCLALLKGFNRRDWKELVVLHFGH